MGDGLHGTMQPEMTASEPVPPPRLKKLARLSARREQEGKTVSWVFICTTYFNFLLIQKVLKSAKQDKWANVLFKLILREDLCLLIKPPLISRRQAHKSRRTDRQNSQEIRRYSWHSLRMNTWMLRGNGTRSSLLSPHYEKNTEIH